MEVAAIAGRSGRHFRARPRRRRRPPSPTPRRARRRTARSSPGPLEELLRRTPSSCSTSSSQGARGDNATSVSQEVDNEGNNSWKEDGHRLPIRVNWFKKRFNVISGVSTPVGSKQIVKLAKNKHRRSDHARLQGRAHLLLEPPALWRTRRRSRSFWPSIEIRAPDADRRGRRLEHRQHAFGYRRPGAGLRHLPFRDGPNTTDGDGRGATARSWRASSTSSADGHSGAAPGTKLVSVDVQNDDGHTAC